MAKIHESELRYDYKWTTTKGDNPHLIHGDAKHLSRKEGYEMLDFLNHLGVASDGRTVVYNSGSDMAEHARLYVEWMLKEHFKSTAPGRPKVVDWINDNWTRLRVHFPGLKPKKG